MDNPQYIGLPYVFVFMAVMRGKVRYWDHLLGIPAMKKPLRIMIVLLCIAFAVYVGDIPLLLSPHGNTSEHATWYRVVRIVDGDTIVIKKDDADQSVRLIGIDTPEVDSSYTKSECFGAEASAEAHTLMEGRDVRIEVDPSQDTYDAYGRLLAYVYVPADVDPEGILVNEYMIEHGFAREYTFKRAYEHRMAFLRAEQEAKHNKRGMWADDACAKP